MSATDRMIERIEECANQREAAAIYAEVIRRVNVYVPAVNHAIRERWPKGLERVKAHAWKIVEGKVSS